MVSVIPNTGFTRDVASPENHFNERGKERTKLEIDILPFEIKGRIVQEFFAIKEIARSVDSYSTGK